MTKPVPCRSLTRPLCLAALAWSLVSCGPDSGIEATDRARVRHELREQLRRQLGDAYDESIPPGTAVQLLRGAEIYEVLCAGCHGPEGLGDGPAGRRLDPAPPAFARAGQEPFFSDRARLRIIRDGISGSPMIGWKKMLDDDELTEVFQFVRSLSSEGGTEEDR